MGTAVLNAAFLALTLVPLAKEFFPGQKGATTVVRVGAGMTKNGDGASSTGGNTPNIALFDNNGQRLGFKRGLGHGKVRDGEYSDIEVGHIDSGNNKPASYISLSSGGTDALCIAYLAITWATGDKFQWYGNMGQQCGMAWYPSTQQVSTDKNPNYTPPCVWIDSPDPGTGDAFPEGFSFHVTDFQFTQANTDPRAMGYQNNPDTMCKAPARFSTYPSLMELQCIPVYDPVLPYQEDGTDPTDVSLITVPGKIECDPSPGVTPTFQQTRQLQQWSGGRFPEPQYGTKRDVKPRQSSSSFCDDSRVIVSHFDQHSAREVCESGTSAGPDFVSTAENLFCDMCTHKLYDVCQDSGSTGCFDLDARQMRNATSHQVRSDRSYGHIPSKVYKRTVMWSPDGHESYAP